MRIAISLAALILLSGCNAWKKVTKPDPVYAQCREECFKPCAPLLPLLDWVSRSADECRALLERDGDTFKVNKVTYEECETRRDACASCLVRLESGGVIYKTGTPAPTR